MGNDSCVKERLIVCASKKGYEFLSFVSSYGHLCSTDINIYCPKHDHTWEAKASYLIRGRAVCSHCTKHRKATLNKIDDKVMQERFESLGSYPTGTSFTRSTVGKQMWEVVCSVCSKDDFVKAGVCTGVFRQGYGSLCDGNKSCRCSVGYRWTKRQREYQVVKSIIDEGLNYEFLGWASYKQSGDTAKITIECGEHGVFQPYLDTYLNGETRCPGCAVHGFKPHLPAFIYVIKTQQFTGYGITIDLKQRMSVHRKFLKRAGDSIEDFATSPLLGEDAARIEAQIIRTFPHTETRVNGFIKESTLLSEYENVIKFVLDNIN